ncbi:MAG: 3-deoxy-D-manno-octulosonic acid transferase [Desulfovibrionaceae bacterium]
MFIYLYNLLSKIAIMMLSKNERLKEGLEERYAKNVPHLSSSLWIQAASAGEAYLVESLLYKIDEQSRDFFLTTWTKQGMEILLSIKGWAREHRPLWNVEVRYFPFDTCEQMRKVLDLVKPRMVLFLETEIWPALLYECKKKSIPTIIINGRMSEKSCFWYKKISYFLKAFSPCVIAAISKRDELCYKRVFSNAHVEYINNIKFTRLKKKDKIYNDVVIPTKNKEIVLFASMRVKEKDSIVEFLQSINRDIICIIVPRHLHLIDEFKSALSESGIEYSLRTEGISQTKDVIIWDTFGELSALYMKSKIVFVGGTLYKEYGGQNFLEPLLYGVVPIVGPFRSNFLWAEEGLQERKLLECVNTVEELVKVVQNKIDHGCLNYTDEFQKWLYPKTRAIEELFFMLQKHGFVL